MRNVKVGSMVLGAVIGAVLSTAVLADGDTNLKRPYVQLADGDTNLKRPYVQVG
jgi:hypothetical protein